MQTQQNNVLVLAKVYSQLVIGPLGAVGYVVHESGTVFEDHLKQLSLNQEGLWQSQKKLKCTVKSEGGQDIFVKSCTSVYMRKLVRKPAWMFIFNSPLYTI